MTFFKNVTNSKFYSRLLGILMFKNKMFTKNKKKVIKNNYTNESLNFKQTFNTWVFLKIS